MAGGDAQLVHGLRLRSEVCLPGATLLDGDADFEVSVAEPQDSVDSPPSGQLVAALDGPGAGYAATVDGDRLTLRFFDLGDFEIDLSGGTIVARPAPGRGAAMVPVLLAGNVLALVLGLRGDVVLHASAVELAGAAVAFVGPTGVGKSTLAALMCEAGATLVGDDAARIEESDGAVLVHHGPHELRLRPQARALADRLTGAVRTTADDRLGVETTSAEGTATRLGAIVVPRWSAGSGPRATQVGPREALEALLASPRVAGWRVPGPIRSHFVACGRIADALPAFNLELPRGVIEDPEAAVALRDALGAAGAFDLQSAPPR